MHAIVCARLFKSNLKKEIVLHKPAQIENVSHYFHV